MKIRKYIRFNDSNFLNKFFKSYPIISLGIECNQEIINIENYFLFFILAGLKLDIICKYRILSFISGVDLLIKNYRFSIVYDLLNINKGYRLRVKTYLNEIIKIPTVTPIYICADWWQREVYDMYGILFDNYIQMTRILTDYGFEGFPLRKDFPLIGYTEMRYSEQNKALDNLTVGLFK